ncbi:GPI transamidase component PIG-T [Linum grandiflorum]
MLLSLRFTLLLSLFLLLSSRTLRCGSAVELVGGGEEFHEELLLKPLPDRKVLTHFHFQSRAPESNGRHHHLFPKAIAQLVQKYRVKEMELSFTQGRWNYERWGGFDPVSSSNAKPPGVELWAVFDISQDQVDSYWKNLTHTLSGLFCASINFLESSTMYSAPKRSFRETPGNLRYGTLPREAVCTENLTPWLKLFPCRDKAGLSSLMDRPSIYKGFYHSQRLHLTSNASRLVDTDLDVTLQQTLTVVLQPNSDSIHSREREFQPSWSISSIFGRKVSGKCGLAQSSKVYLQLDKDIISEQKENVNDIPTSSASVGFTSETSFELSVNPDRSTGFLEAHNVGDGCELQVDVFQVVPWYIKVYYHTLKLFVDDQAQPVGKFIEKVHVSPSVDKKSPGMMEMVLKLPCDVRSAALTLDFDKGFLHIDEYPPDANQGYDIPSAVISYTGFHSGMYLAGNNSIQKSPMLSSFQEKKHVKSYTEVLLVPLTTPDFSMPYNVITITCTVFALYFGSLLNVLRRRAAEEERYLKEKATKKNGRLSELLTRLSAKLRGKPLESQQPTSDSSSSLINSKLILKVILVAAFAVVLQLYFTRLE